MNILTRLWMCWIFASALSAGASGGAMDEAQAVIERLEALGMVADQALSDRLIEAVVVSFDPGAMPVGDASRQADRRARRIYDPGLILGLTNEVAHVAAVRPDSPAEDAGIEIGSQLQQIDQQAVSALGLHPLMQRLRASTPESLELVWRSPAGLIATQTLSRTSYLLPGFKPGERLPFDLGYLRIHRLDADTADGVLSQLQAWRDDAVYGVVLDLRGADGEDLDAVESIAGGLAQSGDFLFAFRDAADQDLRVATAAADTGFAFPMMVLIDEETGGAAEVLAAVLRDSVRGVMVFGQTSRADFLLREPVEIQAGVWYEIAARRLVTGDGTPYTGLAGVRPDVLVLREDTVARAVLAERSSRRQVVDEEIEQQKLYARTRGDATLRRAVDVLLGLKALDIRPHDRKRSPL